MTIAIDHDDTFSADPHLFLHFIASARLRGHRVIMVTMRYPNQTGGMEEAIQCFDKSDIFFTGHNLKKPFMERQNIHVDIWIDDTPESIPNLVETNGIIY
jgi:hypothetical protein